MAQEIIFQFSATDKNLGALLVEKQDQVRRLNAELRKADEGTVQYKKLTTQIAQTKEEVKNLQTQQKNLNAEAGKGAKQYGDLTEKINLSKQAVKDLTDKQRALSKENTLATAEYNKLTKAAERTKKEIQDLKDKQDALNKKFNDAKFPTDSLLGLRVQYSNLAKEIERLTETERKSDFGKGLIKNAVKLKTEINGVEQSIGRFQGSVGNYKSAFGAIGDQLSGGLATGGVVAAVGAIAAVMKIGTEQALAYEQGLADLSALTGKTGADLKGLEDVAKSLQNIQVAGVGIVSTGPDILNALKLVGGARPELLSNAEALGEVTKNAIILSKASGDELTPSVNALTSVLGQFDLRASESTRVINELAAGAKVGASEIPQTTEALQKFGNVAAISNVTTGESIALIELLADKQLKGAEAGTQLRAIFAKLAGAEILPPEAQRQFDKYGISASILADKTLSLDERLTELSKAQGDAAALTKIFGLENLTAATIITSGTQKIGEAKSKYDLLKEGIEDTNEAFKQAEIRADTAGNNLTNFKNGALNTLGDAFTDFGNDISTVIGWFISLEAQIDKVKNPIIDVFNTIEAGRKRVVALLGFGEKNVNPGQDTRSTIDPFAAGGTLGRTTSLFDFKGSGNDTTDRALKDANAFKVLSEAAGGAGDSISALQSKVKNLKNEIQGTDVGSEKFKVLSKQLKEAQKELKAAKIEGGVIQGPKGKSPEIEAAVGSFNALKKQVSDLTTQLENAPPDQVKRILGNLVEAEARLKAANDQLDRLKKGGERFDFKQSDAASNFDAQAQFAQARVDELFAGNDLPQPTEIASILLDASEARREAVVENNALIVDNEQLTADELVAIQKGLIDRKEALTKEEVEQETKDREGRKKTLLEAAADVADGIGQFVISSGRAAIDADQKQKEEALQLEYERRIAAANGNAQQELQIKKEFDKKKADLEKAGAKQRQNQAVKEALINTALAIIRALATGNFIAAGLAAVLGGLQVAAIKKQQFAKGGPVGDSKMIDYYGSAVNSIGRKPGGLTGVSRMPPDETGERPVNAQLHEREWVAPRWMAEHPVYGQDIGYLEKVRKRGFAAGGFSSPPIQISRVNIPSESSSAIATFTDAQTVAIGKIIAEEVKNAAREGVYAGAVDGNSESVRMAERKQRGNENRIV